MRHRSTGSDIAYFGLPAGSIQSAFIVVYESELADATALIHPTWA